MLVLLLLLGLSTHGWARPADSLSFRYQPYDRSRSATACTHQKASVGVYEWDVQCPVDGKIHDFDVHLVLTYYPKTIEGGAGYELLYWVTEVTTVPTRHDSLTQWIHLPEEGDRVKKLESFLGIENDMASLQLTIRPN